MFQNFKAIFIKATALNKLIYLNVIIFIFINLINVFLFMFQINIDPFIHKFYLPSNTKTLILQPWSFISYMFLHNSILHLISNMIFLHISGKIFLQYLHPKQFFGVYILGGISGGLLFIISFNLFPSLTQFANNASAIGASASVLAVMVAISTYKPNYTIQMPFIGSSSLKSIAIIFVVIDLISIPNGNAGGHIAHLGGAIFGYIYMRQLINKKDYSNIFIYIWERLLNLFKTKNKLHKVHKRTKTDYEFNSEKVEKQKEIDKILDKIAKSGYESLSKKEKQLLFSASKK